MRKILLCILIRLELLQVRFRTQNELIGPRARNLRESNSARLTFRAGCTNVTTDSKLQQLNGKCTMTETNVQWSCCWKD